MPRSVSIATGPGHRSKSTLAKLAKKVNKNSRLLNAREMNFARVTIDASPDTTAVVQLISEVGQGDEDNQRIGRKIHAESIELTAILSKNSAATFNSVRMVIVCDNLGSTTPPVVTDVFENENDFFNGQMRSHSSQNLRRFTILMDKHIILNEAFDNNISAKSIRFKKKLNFNIYFTGAATTDEGKNCLYLISGSDEGTNVPAVVGDTMFVFSDL